MNRIVPNSYQKPNIYTDRLMHLLTGDEWKTLDYALRRTFGFQKEKDRISVSQFMNGNGRLDEEGRPVEYGTGLGREPQVAAINELMRFGILLEIAPNNAQNHGRLWMLQLDEREIHFDLLRERAEIRLESGRKRTAAARDAALAGGIGLSSRPAVPVSQTDQYRSVQQTSTGLSSRPAPVCPADSQKPSKKPSRNPVETQTPAGADDAAVGVAWLALVTLCEGNEERAAAVWRLQERFAVVTQLKRPDPATTQGRAKLEREWWPNLLLTLGEADYDPISAEAALEEAFRSMVQREKPLTVVGPQSVVKVAAAVMAGKRRGAPAGLKQRPKGMVGIDAYADRRGLHHGD